MSLSDIYNIRNKLLILENNFKWNWKNSIINKKKISEYGKFIWQIY